MTQRILFLDIDGVLNSSKSRQHSFSRFDPNAIQAMKLLIGEGRPDRVVVHSSWRKLPEPPGYSGGYCWSHEYWFGLLRDQGLSELADLPHEDAPFTLTSCRVTEILMWLADNDTEENRYVVLDDEIRVDTELSEQERLLVIQTDDDLGLTLPQARDAVQWLTHGTGVLR